MSTPLLRRLAQYQQQQQQEQGQEPNNNAGLTRRTQSIKRPLPPVPPTTTTHTNNQQPQQQPPLTAISINKLNSQENRTADQGPSRTKPLPQPPAPSRPIIPPTPPVHGRPTELSNSNYHPYHQQPHTHNQFIPHHHHHHHQQQLQQTASFHQLPPFQPPGSFQPPSNFHPQLHPQPSSSDHHHSFSHHADHRVVDEQTIHATDERGDQQDVQQALVVDSEPRDDSGHEVSNEEEKPGEPELVVPRMVFNDDDDHDDNGVSRAEESEEDSLPGIMVTEEEGVPGIVVSVDSPPAPKGTTRKKPFIADEGRRTSGPRGATVGGPRTITPVRKAERVVSTEARSRQRSVPQMIVSSTDEDSSDQHPREHHHHQQSRDDCPPRQLAAPIGPHSLACAGCRQLIAGRIVHALDAKWHPDCFVCQHCSLVLEHVAFYEHEGKAYCGVDYDELFSLKCYHCNTSINEDSYVSLDDPSLKDGPRHYHKLHLFCSECGDPFIDPKSLEEQSRISALPNTNRDRMPMTVDEPKPFVLFNGYPYCEKCDVRLHRPKCFTCKAPITDDFINALNKLFHSECFVCFECHNPFSNNQFFLVPYADLDPSVDPKSKRGAQQVPICLNCYS
ncbi:hypothetical protein PGTUg99_031493 [Puccinia graminis f. sp. tritici]|uniref:LIM zinc-binding domain-containing protein n=1 Tax=Puccinia graminis f. sp. tritici TaxID=56615 RepID=A0A5B0RUI5_PUCGR|nr:hypothetical protein PGTUg99_031493 [Puccinia graminis f. sp. tritici]